MFSGRVCWEGRRTNMVLFFLNCISCRCRLLGGFGPRDGTSRTFLKNRTFQKFFVRRPSQQEPSQKYMCRFKFLLCPTSHPQPSQKTMWRFKLFWVSQPSQQQPKNANKHWSLPSWSSPTLSWLKSRLSNYFCPMRVKAEMYRQAVKAGQGGFEPLTSRHRHWIASDLEPLILDFGFRILDFGFRILDFGFWILDFEFWILDFEFWILERYVADLFVPILDFGFRVLDFGFGMSWHVLGPTQVKEYWARRPGSADKIIHMTSCIQPCTLCFSPLYWKRTYRHDLPLRLALLVPGHAPASVDGVEQDLCSPCATQLEPPALAKYNHCF